MGGLSSGLEETIVSATPTGSLKGEIISRGPRGAWSLNCAEFWPTQPCKQTRKDMKEKRAGRPRGRDPSLWLILRKLPLRLGEVSRGKLLSGVRVSLELHERGPWAFV